MECFNIDSPLDERTGILSQCESSKENATIQNRLIATPPPQRPKSLHIDNSEKNEA
jgi:hypothetical protein